MEKLTALATLYNTPGAPQSAEGLRKMLKAQGISISIREINEFLKEQSTHQIHRKKKPLNLNVQTSGSPFEIWESDVLH